MLPRVPVSSPMPGDTIPIGMQPESGIIDWFSRKWGFLDRAVGIWFSASPRQISRIGARRSPDIC